MALHFEKRDCLTLPGLAEKPNEDSWGFTPAAACVFDGATGLGESLLPGPSDACWIANFAARRFCAHAQSGVGAIGDWLRETASEAESSFRGLRRRPPRENYEIPYASGVMMALSGDAAEILWFGDCAVLLNDETGAFVLAGDTIAKRDGERARVERIRRANSTHPAGPIVRDEFLPSLRASRNFVNTGDDWLFAPDAQCASHARSTQIRVAPGARVLLASDGLLALATDYRRFTLEELYSAAFTEGLESLGKELRAIEAGDPSGVSFPRFKTSDDATGLLLQICA